MRDQTLEDFKNGNLKYLVNVNVLTMGFDAPNIDCVAMVRPTMSPGLYYQMVGRGFRLHPDKDDCLVLDFGGNVMRHGPVDQIRIQTIETRGEGAAPAKECPQCQALVATGFAVCPHCGFVFPEPETNQHDAEASTEGILSGEVSIDEYEVQDIYYAVHTKRDANDDAPKTLRVEYRVGWQQYHSEWVCFEHSGWARQKAESWWRLRSNAPIPNTAAEAVAMANQGALCETKSITVRSTTGEQYDRIVGYEHGDIPEWNEDAVVDSEADYCMADDEIPF
jgi:DNA repair protein RadD